MEDGEKNLGGGVEMSCWWSFVRFVVSLGTAETMGLIFQMSLWKCVRVSGGRVSGSSPPPPPQGLWPPRQRSSLQSQGGSFGGNMSGRVGELSAKQADSLTQVKRAQRFLLWICIRSAGIGFRQNSWPFILFEYACRLFVVVCLFLSSFSCFVFFHLDFFFLSHHFSLFVTFVCFFCGYPDLFESVLSCVFVFLWGFFSLENSVFLLLLCSVVTFLIFFPLTQIFCFLPYSVL